MAKEKNNISNGMGFRWTANPEYVDFAKQVLVEPDNFPEKVVQSARDLRNRMRSEWRWNGRSSSISKHPPYRCT